MLILPFATTLALFSPMPSPHRSISADSTSTLLTVDALTKMTTFWTAFMQEPPAVRDTGRKANQDTVQLDVGTGTPTPFSGVNITAMATHFPSVATDLTRAHLTAAEWEQDRNALVAAMLAQQAGGNPPASSAVANNMAFLKAHPQEVGVLRATGMWFPKGNVAAQPSPSSGPPSGPQDTTLAAVQAKDQAQTQFIYKMLSGRPLKSPRDTARMTLGTAHVVIDYGSPSKRGRAIFGGLVPYDKVWRTGANAATVLVTDKPIMIDTLHIPAGQYTLYTIPSASGWQLIVNKEVGQWGLEYHQEYDLGRVPMMVSSVTTSVEQFHIDITKKTLQLQWDTTVAQVPIRTQH